MELEELLGNFVEQKHHDNVSIGSPSNHGNEIMQYDNNDASGKINLETLYKSFLLHVK